MDCLVGGATRGSDVNIPNFITVFRIFLVPVVIWLIIDGDMQLAFIGFVLAGVSDALDGFLAKRYGWQTELGAYLDPIADKVLLVSIYVALGVFGHLPVWLVIAVVTRDILIIGAFLLSWLLGRSVEVKPLFISKANTVGQIVLAALIMGDIGFALGLADLTGILVWVTGILTVLSAAAYLVTWLRDMASYEPVPPPQPRALDKAAREGRMSRSKSPVRSA
jgi:cardiolipin synthase